MLLTTVTPINKIFKNVKYAMFELYKNEETTNKIFFLVLSKQSR